MTIWMAIGLSLCALAVIAFRYDPYSASSLVKLLFYGAGTIVILGIVNLVIDRFNL